MSSVLYQRLGRFISSLRRDPKLTSETSRPHPHRGGFTLVEILLVLAIVGVLATLLVPDLLPTPATQVRQAAFLHLKECVVAAEARRELASTTVTLPGNCEALGLPQPPHVTGTSIQLSGTTYTLMVEGQAGGRAFTDTETLPRTIIP